MQTSRSNMTKANTILCVSITLFLFNVITTFASNNRIRVDVRANDDNRNTMTESDVTTPVRLRGDKTKHHGKHHYRTKSHNRPIEHEDAEFEHPQYKISSFGDDMIVELTPDLDLLSPAYTTTYAWPNATDNRDRKGSRLQGCFYKGKVVGQPSSQVTVSICEGLTGAIRTENFEYFITPLQPSTDDTEESEGKVPHSIHRRSIGSKKRRSARGYPCGVNDRRHHRRYSTTFMSDLDRIVNTIRSKRSITEVNSAETNFQAEEAEKTHSRSKRGFSSSQHYIETMVVADKTMVDHHGDDLEHYILTIMMVANRVFAHPSLGNAVTLSIVRIMQAEDDLVVSSNAARALRDFCEWQTKHNTPDDTDPNHYDLAVLLTRRDLCGDSCDTLGMAEVGAMCSTKHSCAIVEDDGLSAAYTVAHEIGHVLNMMHDDNRLCRVNFAHINPDTHIMSSTMNRVDNDQPWSLCSKEAITDFLESGRGSCMLDRPREVKIYPTKLPGEMYDVNAQCEMSFGPGAKECPFMQECVRLWCHTTVGKNQCHTRHFPRADGSPCGRDLHCFQGKCVTVDQVRIPQDGQWNIWGSFGTCSRTCGGGVQMSSRECNNPAPENGGKYCTGARLRFRSCNTDPCPSKKRDGGPNDFRSEQCATFNGQSFPLLGIKTVSTWIPKYTDISENDRCRLTCQSVQTGVFVKLASKVTDGTKCGPNTTDICVQGICMEAGCDGILGSKTKFDRCGVCGGKNKRCKRVKGAYKKRQSGYNDVVKIPEGAASIVITQRGYRNKLHDGNYLAIKDWNGRYILNGGLTLSTSRRDITINGTIIRYTGVSATTEKIEITGKTRGELQIQVLSLEVGTKGRILPPRIKYVYYVSSGKSSKPTKPPKGNKPGRKEKPRKVSWVTGGWSKCKPKAGKCGSGWKVRRVTCKNERRQSVTGCESRVKPYDKLPCVLRCETSAPNIYGNGNTRGRGNSGPSGGITRSRPKPPSSPVLISRFGDGYTGQAVWVLGRWGPCSRSCEKGIKYRHVTCRGQNGYLLGESQCQGKKPVTRHGCMLRSC